MNKKFNIVSLGKLMRNVLEIYLPSLAFITLFLSFLIGIIFRYVLKNPQSWTFELSSICYLAVGVLSWGIAHRTDDNVVFDMLYNKLSNKVQCILRIVSNIVIVATALVLIVPSITYLEGMKNLTTQIIKIPRYLVFVPFTVSFVSAAARSTYRTVLDIRSFVNKDYSQHYGKKEEVVE